MIWRALRAEGMKLKPAACWLPVISSLLFIAFMALEWYLNFRKGPGGVYSAFNVMYLFLGFVMLLNTALFTGMLTGVEQESNSWKQLLTLPVARPYLYWAKAIWVLLLLLCTAFLIIGGMVLLWICYTSEPLPFQFLIQQIMYSFLASAAVLGLQMWLSTQLANQSIPMSIGFLGAVSGLFIARDSGAVWARLWPWAYPTLSSPFMPGAGMWIAISVGLGAILLTAGALHFNNKQF
ncbi:ABC transporter permease [Paenibacillus sp. HW567]|uniref:ABC transporter permease n=1 Tax=Paenibacillus sp. HW567 TaxID=1034769 RepID=UPI0003686973|nr:ABC transporter permease [Paenibacillus sp. HW567]